MKAPLLDGAVHENVRDGVVAEAVFTRSVICAGVAAACKVAAADKGPAVA